LVPQSTGQATAIGKTVFGFDAYRFGVKVCLLLEEEYRIMPLQSVMEAAAAIGDGGGTLPSAPQHHAASAGRG